MVVVLPSSTSYPELPIDVFCGSLPAKLYHSKLKDGSSHCISFDAEDGLFVTLCESECHAGLSSARN